MATTPKQSNGSPTNNGNLGKRKKNRGKGSYLSKWLDKTMQHIQEATPSTDTYDPFLHPNSNWMMNSVPGYDPCRFNMFGYTPEPLSLPSLPTYFNPSVQAMYNLDYQYVNSANKSIQVQRPRLRRRSDKPEEVITPNGLNTNYMQPKNLSDSQEFASLPPIVTSVGDTTSNSDMNTNEKDTNSNARRFSDPCVSGLPDVARPANGEIDSESESSSNETGSQVGSRLLSYLLDQIMTLKLANERLNKDLIDTKVELDNIRQQNAMLQKGNSSGMGLPGHPPLNSNGLLGMQYSPGFVTDVVREIRDAARMREEAVYSRVHAMLMERTDNGLASSSTDGKYTEKALEEIKSSLRASEADKRRMMDRIIKLEDEMRALRLTSLESNDNRVLNGNMEDSESERLRLRKELADMRKAKQTAEEHALKLERLVTQLRSKFNGVQPSNGPDSLPSESEQDTNRARRTSVNSSNNSTVVFGPVTDL